VREVTGVVVEVRITSALSGSRSRNRSKGRDAVLGAAVWSRRDLPNKTIRSGGVIALLIAAGSIERLVATGLSHPFAASWSCAVAFVFVLCGLRAYFAGVDTKGDRLVSYREFRTMEIPWAEISGFRATMYGRTVVLTKAGKEVLVQRFPLGSQSASRLAAALSAVLAERVSI
jgi:hypothetical protein